MACSRSALLRPRASSAFSLFLEPGAIVGELAMIDGLPRSATIQAVRDCELTFVGRAAFTETLHQHPQLYVDIVTTLAARRPAPVRRGHDGVEFSDGARARGPSSAPVRPVTSVRRRYRDEA